MLNALHGRLRAPAVLGLVLLLAGCFGPKFDGSSADAFRESYQAVADAFDGDFSERFYRAVNILATNRDGWDMRKGESAVFMLEDIESLQNTTDGGDEILLEIAARLTTDRARAITPANEYDPERRAYDLLGKELDGKTADDVLGMAEDALPGLRRSFQAFRDSLLDRLAAEVAALEADYKRKLSPAGGIEVEVTSLTPSHGSKGGNFSTAMPQDLFSFRIVNKTNKTAQMVVFMRGDISYHLLRISYELPKLLRPGQTAEYHNIGIGSGDLALDTRGKPQVLNVRFTDGSWAQPHESTRPLSAPADDVRRAWKARAAELEKWRRKLAK